MHRQQVRRRTGESYTLSHKFDIIQESIDVIEPVTALNMLAEIDIGHREIHLESASVAPTQANKVIHARIGFEFKYGPGLEEIGSIDFVSGAARRYRPLVLPYARSLQGPGELYAAVLVEVSGTGIPFSFNVAYRVIK